MVNPIKEEYLEYLEHIKQASSLDSQGNPIHEDTRGLVSKIAEEIFLREPNGNQDHNWRFAQCIMADVSARFYPFCSFMNKLTTMLKKEAEKYKTGDEKKDWDFAQKFVTNLILETYNKSLDGTNVCYDDLKKVD